MKPFEMLTLCGLLAASGCAQAEAAVDKARALIGSVGADESEAESERESESESESESVSVAESVAESVDVAGAGDESKADGLAAGGPVVDAPVEPKIAEKAEEPVAETEVAVAETEKPETETETETPDAEPTVVLAASKSGPGCLAGTWAVDSLPFVEKSLRRQAHGRSVRPLGDATGTVDLTIDPTAGTLRVAADHWRQRYGANLAGVKVTYRVDLDGELEAPLTVGADGTLTVGRPDHRTLYGSERVSFDGHSPRSRAMAMPLKGELEFTCEGDTLTLDNPRSRGGKLSFIRARPGASS